MGADLNLLTLRAQHWICLEVTQPQQFIPYSSYEDSFWSFALANIRVASGASSASSNATTSPPRIFPLCSSFGLLLYFHLHSPLTLFSFLAPPPKLPVLLVFQWISICIIEVTDMCSNHLTCDWYAAFFWNSCQACLQNSG